MTVIRMTTIRMTCHVLIITTITTMTIATEITITTITTMTVATIITVMTTTTMTIMIMTNMTVHNHHELAITTLKVITTISNDDEFMTQLISMRRFILFLTLGSDMGVCCCFVVDELLMELFVFVIGNIC